MNATAYFIKDRAETLVYEALQFPATSAVALAWLNRAMAQAEKLGLIELADEVGFAVMRITDHATALEYLSNPPQGLTQGDNLPDQGIPWPHEPVHHGNISA